MLMFEALTTYTIDWADLTDSHGFLMRYFGKFSTSDVKNPKYTEGSFKYFSGTASYQNTFKINQLDKKSNYEIGLGNVKNVAEVIK
jgi:hypothetical protein